MPAQFGYLRSLGRDLSGGRLGRACVRGRGLLPDLVSVVNRGVDDATAGRVRNIVDALHADSPDHLDSALLTTNQRVVAIQLIAPDGRVVKRAGSAPATPLISTNEFDFNLRRGMPDDAVR